MRPNTLGVTAADFAGILVPTIPDDAHEHRIGIAIGTGRVLWIDTRTAQLADGATSTILLKRQARKADAAQAALAPVPSPPPVPLDTTTDVASPTFETHDFPELPPLPSESIAPKEDTQLLPQAEPDPLPPAFDMGRAEAKKVIGEGDLPDIPAWLANAQGYASGHTAHYEKVEGDD